MSKIKLTKKEKMEVYRDAWKLCNGASYERCHAIAHFASNMVGLQLYTAEEIKQKLADYYAEG